MYCPSKAEIMACIKVLRPVHFLSHLKLGLSETPQGKLNRLCEYAKDLICGSQK
jgi:hypothetical protein